MCHLPWETWLKTTQKAKIGKRSSEKGDMEQTSPRTRPGQPPTRPHKSILTVSVFWISTQPKWSHRITLSSLKKPYRTPMTAAEPEQLSRDGSQAPGPDLSLIPQGIVWRSPVWGSGLGGDLLAAQAHFAGQRTSTGPGCSPTHQHSTHCNAGASPGTWHCLPRHGGSTCPAHTGVPTAPNTCAGGPGDLPGMSDGLGSSRSQAAVPAG